MKSKPLVIFLIGPTASGKTDVACELAKKINAEIISADSMQGYKGMDIISAKPSKAQRKKVPHHLIDTLKPTEEYSAAKFREKALELIREIHAKGKNPIIVGGTGLYIKALKEGLFDDKGKDKALRVELEQEAKQKGVEHLYKKLEKIDPVTAKKIHHNDLRRIIRALEVYAVNNIPLSKLKTQIQRLDKIYRIKIFGLKRDRKELYLRIEQRVDKMFELGVINEVEKLINKKLSQTAQKALGIRQISDYLNKKCSLDEAKDLLKRDTRRFAKRQLTWFRQDKDIIWIDIKQQDSAQDIITKILPGLPAN